MELCNIEYIIYTWFSLLGRMEGVPAPAENLLIPPPTGKNLPSRLYQIFIPRPLKVNSPPPTPQPPPTPVPLTPLNNNFHVITQ